MVYCIIGFVILLKVFREFSLRPNPITEWEKIINFFSCFRSLLAQNKKWIRHAVSTYFVSNQTFTTCLVETFRQQQKYNTPTHSPRKWVPKVSFHPCTTMTRHKIHPNHKHSGLDWLVVIYFYFLPLGNNKRKLATLILSWYLLTLV